MATTTHTDGSNGIPPQAELDKLGPIGGKAAVLDDDAELRTALVEEFLSASEGARDAATEVDAGSSGAVHDYRKALRRARAVLSLVGNALPKNERRAVKKALQEARRSVSAVRDHAVAPDTLATLALGEDDRATANAVLAKAAEAMPPVSEIKQRLAEGAARAAAQVEALEAALPQAIPLEVVIGGAKEIYRGARRARRKAKRDPQAFHTWRRRTKELVYQLELLSDWAGDRVTSLHHDYEGVADVMSAAVDLIMLGDFVDTHGQGLAGLEHLKAAIDAQLDDLMRDARKASRDAFERSAREFAKKLQRSVRKDLAPAAVR